MKHEIREILYMHVQASERFVISNGMSFWEFVNSLEKPLQHLLLLKHDYSDTQFNLNVALDYVPSEGVAKFIKQDVRAYGEFCWIDFQEEDSLDELSGMELAELLYLGHMKHHLKQPFFSKLHNQFVYLSQDDGWFSKIYYRSLPMYYKMLGSLISLKLEGLKTDRTWFGLRKKRDLPIIPVEVLEKLSAMLSEGVVFSLKHAIETRVKMEIPIWVVGDFMNMDDMLDHYHELQKQEADAYITFLWKTKEWSIVLNK
ncbi:hypothetical protein [Peribacillus asahii]|uniref:hypothetical protein n=1 Tax=Peribacillus asahii TaxID=228899 RepID=UPI00380D76F7